MVESYALGPVVAPDRLRELTRKSDLKGAIMLASHLLALVASGWLLWLTWGSWWGVPVFAVHGLMINYLYAAQHEASHDTVFRTRWINEWIGRFTGFVLMYPRDYDRWQHLAHHRNTQNPDKDPELLPKGGGTGLVSYLVALSGITLWYGLGKTMITHARGIAPANESEYYLSDKQKKAVIAEARWHLAGYVLIAILSVAFQTWAAVILWVAPTVAMVWAHQLQNYIEHGGLPLGGKDIWTNTRTVKTNAFMGWLSWQMIYHAAHHTYPAVPFHHLKELNDEIVAARGGPSPSAGYFGFQARAIADLARGTKDADAYV
jgi:fatty acid desaturase